MRLLADGSCCAVLLCRTAAATAHWVGLPHRADHGIFMLAGKGKKPMLIAIKMNVGSTIMLALK